MVSAFDIDPLLSDMVYLTIVCFTAYHDVRFNPDIDKVTGFRTRTILCYPVLSSTNELLGVIQMVNKKKGDAKELRDKAKKKKSDDTNKGMSCHCYSLICVRLTCISNFLT